MTNLPVVVLGHGDAARAKRRLVERAGGVCVGEADAKGASLAFVAIEDEGEAIAAAKRMRACGLIVNVTDRPSLCEFTVPSLIDRDPVIVAVGTGGASAGLAKMLRLRLERMLPQQLGRLATMLSKERAAIRTRWTDATARRRALDVALAEGGALDPLVEHGAQAVSDWLQQPNRNLQTGVFTIRLRSEDPDDLTLREARMLGSADVVLHDAAVPPAILTRARADAAFTLLLPEPAQPEPGLLTVVICLP
ncbi:NAD(P)-dependent oxidoreductase [Croceicoccus sp. F390]|uniref:precorrin-2 dehydrogenase n=1 Tax=Croceicoccus esteveae TaxID=3075597 RepID=A0ABU2ZF97_9SPHN|nr:NAD(P)-dependent oxidoreductase [Croceicoccus sp. F390]MDT0575263.1 NAD(P)-dependent oxidoreductase [Croceicoccus sp. F390]